MAVKNKGFQQLNFVRVSTSTKTLEQARAAVVSKLNFNTASIPDKYWFASLAFDDGENPVNVDYVWSDEVVQDYGLAGNVSKALDGQMLETMGSGNLELTEEMTEAMSTNVITPPVIGGSQEIEIANPRVMLTFSSFSLLSDIDILEYIVDWGDGSAPETVSAMASKAEHVYAVQQDGTELDVVVKARDEVGNVSKPTKMILAFSDDTAVKAPFGGVFGDVLADQVVTTTFSGQDDDDIDSYVIEEVKGGIRVDIAEIEKGQSHRFRFPRVRKRTSYSFKVRGRKKNGKLGAATIVTGLIDPARNPVYMSRDVNGAVILDEDDLMSEEPITLTQESDQGDWRKYRATVNGASEDFALQINGEAQVIKSITDEAASVIQFETNGYSTLALLSNGKVKGVGYGGTARFGNGSLENLTSWTTLPLPDNVVKIGSFRDNTTPSLALLADGTLYGCGNAYGLGLGGTGRVDNWTAIASDVEDFWTAKYVTIVKLKDGKYKVTGHGGNGRLGTGSKSHLYNWADWTSPGDVKQMLLGEQCYLLTTDNKLYAWGMNQHGQLGLGDTEHKLTPQLSHEGVDKIFIHNIDNSAMQAFILTLDGTLKAVGQNRYGQLGIGNKDDQKTWVDVPLNGVTKVSSGGYHTLFLLDDGKVYGCGYNNRYQLTNIEGMRTQAYADPVYLGLDEVTDIMANGWSEGYSMVVRTQDDILYAAGSRRHGRLGDGYTSSRHSNKATWGIVGSIKDYKGLFGSQIGVGAVVFPDKIKMVGNGKHGSLGNGSTATQGKFVDSASGLGQVTLFEEVDQISTRELEIETIGTADQLIIELFEDAVKAI